MPTFPISDSAPDTDYLGLLSIALWPINEARRADFLRSLFARMDAMADEEKRVPYHEWRANWRQVAEALGGRIMISEAPGINLMIEDAKEIMEHGLWAGIAFMKIYQLANQYRLPELATLNRIAHLFESMEDLPRSSFLKSWKEFKPVAHIWAAMFAARILNTNDSIDNPSESKSTIALAIEFQQFGRKFIPVNGKTTLLNVDEAWIIEGDCSAALYPLPPIEADEIEILRGYQAPKSW